MPYIGRAPSASIIKIEDADQDTKIQVEESSDEDTIRFDIAGAEDFTMAANTFTILSGSTLAVASGATIANSGTATGFAGDNAEARVHNHLINGEFQVAQRATSFVAGANDDDVYTLDRWNLVSDGDDIVDVTQSTTVPTGGAIKSIALDVETANKQFGIVQIIEATNCTGLIGNEVTFSFKAKVSNVRLGDVRAGIIAWSSTSDAVTSDVVATYNDDANPTLASNLTFENTPADLGVTTSWVTYSVTGTIDTGSTTNVVVWIGSVDSTTTAGDFLYITDCQLEVGDTATDFEREDITTTRAKCHRYYWQLGPATTATWSIATALNVATTGAYAGRLAFPVDMRVGPTLITSDADTFGVRFGASAMSTCNTIPVYTVSGDATSNAASTQGASLTWALSSGLTAGSSCVAQAKTSAAQLGFDSEM